MSLSLISLQTLVPGTTRLRACSSLKGLTEYGPDDVLREDKPSRTELTLLKTWFRGEECAVMSEWKPRKGELRRNNDGVGFDISIVDEHMEKCKTLARFLEPLVGDYAKSTLLGQDARTASKIRVLRELIYLKIIVERTRIKLQIPGP